MMELQETNVVMRSKMEEMRERLSLVRRFFADVMVEGQDYGTVPGTDKPVLLKCGAEKLCEFYGFAPKITELREEKDINTGYYRVLVVISLYRRNGEHVADGVGEANSYETKYRYRWVLEEDAPEDAKAEAKVRYVKGKKYYRIQNDEMHSIWNTVLKMAKKRALVDAVLTATRSSGIFTQDLEDFGEWIEVEGEVQDDTEHQPERQEPRQGAPQPATPKQIAYVRRLLQGQDADEYVRERYGKRLDEITGAEASEIISSLTGR